MVAPLVSEASGVGALAAAGPPDAGLSAVGAVDSLAGAGGDEGSPSGEEAGVAESEVEGEVALGEVVGAVSDEVGAVVDASGALLVAVGVATASLAVGVEAGDDDDGGGGEVFGDAAGEVVGASAETNPTRATKMRARTTNWRAIFSWRK